MLRNRFRAVNSKQSVMADSTSLPPPQTQNQAKPTSSFLGSPRFLNGFLARNLLDAETVMSPTSILDTKLISTSNSFGYERNLPKYAPEKKQSFEKFDPEGIGLALIDQENHGNHSNNRMVLFGSKLKVQIPPLPPSATSPTDSPRSPGDFGIKTRNLQIMGSSSSPFGSSNCNTQMKNLESPQKLTRGLSLKEMELSEDYTCVITHGPNPKTTHIFDDCIVERCCGAVRLIDLRKESVFDEINDGSSSPASVNFLSFCHTCKDILEEGKDIYMYRGDKAFCSPECRCKEMIFEEMKDAEMDIVGGEATTSF